MGGRRTYERQLREIAEAHGGRLAMGGRHYRLMLRDGVVVPASGSPSRLNGGRPRLVEREVRRALQARGAAS